MFTEKQILQSKTPHQYIDRCLKTKVRRGIKTVISKEWQHRTGYTVKDIMYARHRHPYWKMRKMEGWKRRNEIRWKKYNFEEIQRRGYGWTEKETKKYLELDTKDKHDKYVHKDRQLAKILKTTIPAIQGLRRKKNLISKLRISNNNIVDFMMLGEIYLRAKLYSK